MAEADTDNLVARYLSGVSILQLANEAGRSRWYIADRLRKRGVDIRGWSDAAKSPLRRSRGTKIGKFEADVAAELRERGMECATQKTIGTYNVDIAINEAFVAVEIQRATTSNYAWSSMRRERLIDILNAGWHLLIVYCPARYKWVGKQTIPGSRYDVFDVRAVCDKIITFAHVARRNHAARRQYAVIDGEGNFCTPSRLKLDNWPFVIGF